MLVDGHRRHASSIITFNSGGYRGAVPVDFNTIPVTAIKRVEILLVVSTAYGANLPSSPDAATAPGSAWPAAQRPVMASSFAG